MKKIIVFIVIVIVLGLAGFVYYRYFGGGRTQSFVSSDNNTINTSTTPMTITSTAFAEGQPIPKKYSCDGDGVNPPLEFKDVPAQAKTLALVVEDPDAPTGTWTHWLVWNIDSRATTIAENSVPAGAVQGQTSSGQNNYGGPCPPSGTHRYFFRLYALDSKLIIPSFSDAVVFRQAIDGRTIREAELMGSYSR